MLRASPSSRRRRWPIVAGVGGPLAIAAVWCTLMRTEVRSPLAPLLGPWAGHLYGHEECTLASVYPVASVLASGFGLLGLGALALRHRTGIGLLLLPAALWAVSWGAMALLSVANTCI